MNVLFAIAKLLAAAAVLGGLWVGWLLWYYGPTKIDEDEEGDK